MPERMGLIFAACAQLGCSAPRQGRRPAFNARQATIPGHLGAPYARLGKQTRWWGVGVLFAGVDVSAHSLQLGWILPAPCRKDQLLNLPRWDLVDCQSHRMHQKKHSLQAMHIWKIWLPWFLQELPPWIVPGQTRSALVLSLQKGVVPGQGR